MFHSTHSSTDPDLIDSIPKMLFYSWLSIFAALTIMTGYITLLQGQLSDSTSTADAPATPSRIQAIIDAFGVRPLHRRIRSKTTVSPLRAAAPEPCLQAAPLPGAPHREAP